VGFFFFIYILGFIGGIGVFTALYAGMHRTRWRIAVGLGVFMAVLSYVLFSYTTDTSSFPASCEVPGTGGLMREQIL